MRIAVACVKWGTKYDSEYVNRLRNMVARHLSFPHEFICFTDDAVGLDDGIETRPLIEGLVGWWNKIVLFKPDAFEFDRLVLYFDLDLVIIDSIDFLAQSSADLTILRDPKHSLSYNSSVMAIRAGRCADIYDRFTTDLDHVVRSFKGDQQFIAECRPNAALFPREKILSFKLETSSNAWSWLPLKWPRRHWPAPPWLSTPMPADAAIILFHGLPNPPDVVDKPFGPFKKAPWIAEHWR